jgi:hypothetical protein
MERDCRCTPLISGARALCTSSNRSCRILRRGLAFGNVIVEWEDDLTKQEWPYPSRVLKVEEEE